METQEINFTEVTLRDGEQQEKLMPIMPVGDRLAVFNQIAESGIKRVEIGHLANGHDQDLAKELIQHINYQTLLGKEEYEGLELQVLFGSQPELIEGGLRALGGIDKDSVIVHVYDRVCSQLRGLAKEPQTRFQAAKSVLRAGKLAADLGFTRFSVSGEGAVNHHDDIEEIIEYYDLIVRGLGRLGVSEINVNLANTYGFSAEGQWNAGGLRYFNEVMKEDREQPVTTSVHAHNDNNSASEFAMQAIGAGFDRVEGTMTGMGERTGNVALSDVSVRLFEKARVEPGVLDDRAMPASVIKNLPKWYDICAEISDIYQTERRFAKTSLGNPEAYGAGSGPHAHANEKCLEDPVSHPLWRNYATVALAHAAHGRPEAIKVISADPDYLKKISLDTHAAGGANKRIHGDTLKVASPSDRAEAEAIARQEIEKILGAMGDQPASEAPYRQLATLTT